MPPGAWPFEARPNRFFQPFRDIWQLLKEAAAPAGLLSCPPTFPSTSPRGPPGPLAGITGHTGGAGSTGSASMQHNAVPVPLLSFTTPLFGGSMGARGRASPCHTGASTAGVAKQVGAGEPGPSTGTLGLAALGLLDGLFLTQPVQLVHVVVSGERNLGNVVIWRRTCPLGGNGTVQMNHREGDKAQGTWAQGWL